MANVWYSAIQEIYAQCWFTPPGFVASVNDTVGTGVVDVSVFSRSFSTVWNLSTVYVQSSHNLVLRLLFGILLSEYKLTSKNSRPPVKRNLAGTYFHIRRKRDLGLMMGFTCRRWIFTLTNISILI